MRTGEELKSYPSRFLVKDGEKEILLLAEKIDWVEADNCYCRLHSGERSYMLREMLSDLIDRMAPGGSFVSLRPDQNQLIESMQLKPYPF